MTELKGVKEIRCSMDILEEYAPWFVNGIRSGKIKVRSAVVSLWMGEFSWHSGTWIEGTWECGAWERGIWISGTWLKGEWYVGSDVNGKTRKDSPNNWGTIESKDKLIFKKKVISELKSLKKNRKSSISLIIEMEKLIEKIKSL